MDGDYAVDDLGVRPRGAGGVWQGGGGVLPARAATGERQARRGLHAAPNPPPPRPPTCAGDARARRRQRARAQRAARPARRVLVGWRPPAALGAPAALQHDRGCAAPPPRRTAPWAPCCAPAAPPNPRARAPAGSRRNIEEHYDAGNAMCARAAAAAPPRARPCAPAKRSPRPTPAAKAPARPHRPRPRPPPPPPAPPPRPRPPIGTRSSWTPP